MNDLDFEEQFGIVERRKRRTWLIVPAVAIAGVSAALLFGARGYSR